MVVPDTNVAGEVFIAVALIAFAGTLTTSLFGFMSSRRAKRAAETTRESIGVPNGRGNVVQMLGSILDGQAHQDRRLATLEERSLLDHAALVDQSARLARQGERMGFIELRLDEMTETPTPEGDGP